MRQVAKFFGKRRAVQGLDLEIVPGEFLAIVGPSGCGKSTVLRLIAGLEDPDAGEIRIDGAPMRDVAPKQRNIAMVFQSYALYPHLTVFRNLATPLELRRLPRPEIERRVAEAAELLDISYLLNRKPRLLSGGQRQRVALARAMVRDPALFLLDEPLSNLDAQHRAALRSEIVDVHRRVGSTFVHVTHDQVEAVAMADRIAVMHEGRIEQVAAPQELYDRPANTFVASFFGTPPMNMLHALMQGTCVLVEGHTLPLPHVAGATRDVIVGIRPEHLSIEPPARSVDAAPTFEASVTAVEPMGASMRVVVKAGTLSLVAKLASEHRVRPGDHVRLWADLSQVQLFDPATGVALGRDRQETLH